MRNIFEASFLNEYTSKKEDAEFLMKRLKEFYHFDDDKKDMNVTMFSFWLHDIAKKYKNIIPLENSNKCTVIIGQEVVQKLSNIIPFFNFPKRNVRILNKIYPFKHYLLNEKHEVKECSLMEWGAFTKKPSPLKNIKTTLRLKCQPIDIYTNFIGTIHKGGMFETMSFSKAYPVFNEIYKRCKTYEEAVKQHNKMCDDISERFL